MAHSKALIPVIPPNIAKLAALSSSASAANARASASFARTVTKGALNINGLFVACAIVPSKDKKINYTISKFILGGYNFASFQQAVAEGLDTKYHRWNPDTGCIEVACQRYMTNDEGRNAAKKPEDKYPKDPNDWTWVELPKMGIISFIESNNVTVSASDVASLYKVLALVPRFRDPAKIAKGEKPYAWRKDRLVQHGGVKGHIPDCVFPHIAWTFPEQMFRIEDPRKGAMQEAVLLRVVPGWDTVNWLSKQQEGRAITYTDMVPCADIEPIDAWSFEKKSEGAEPKFWLCKSATDTKKRNTKIYNAAATIVQAEGAMVQLVSARLTFWERDIEAMFCIRDLDLWFNVFRFVVPLFRMVILAGVMADRTAASSLNMAKADDADNDHGVDINDADHEDSSASANTAAANQAAAVAPATEAPENPDDLMGEAVKLNEHEQQGATRDDAVLGKFSFTLALNVNATYFDRNEMRRCLIPVTPEWVNTGMDLIDPATGMKVVDPTTGKPKRTLKPFGRVLPPIANYPAQSKLSLEDHALIGKFSDPAKFPVVTCVSDLLPQTGILGKFSEMVAAGRGEFRVAVNQPMFLSKENVTSIMEVLPGLTPKEGAELLDTGRVVGKPMPWAPIPNPRYCLYYLRTDVDDFNAEKIKDLHRDWSQRIVEHMIPAGASVKQQQPPVAASSVGKARDVDMIAAAAKRSAQEPIVADVVGDAPDAGTQFASSDAGSEQLVPLPGSATGVPKRRRTVTPAAASASSSSPTPDASQVPDL